MTGFVVLSIYRAMLGASLAIKLSHKPFDTIEEVAMSNKILIIRNNTLIHGMVTADSKTDVLTNLNNGNLLPKNQDSATSMKNILNGTYSNALLLADNMAIESMPEFPCQINKLDLVAATQWIGLVYPRNWTYAKLFDWHLKKLKNSGLFYRIIAQHHKGHKGCPNEQRIGATNFMQTFSSFVFLLIGFIIKVFIVTLSQYYFCS